MKKLNNTKAIENSVVLNRDSNNIPVSVTFYFQFDKNNLEVPKSNTVNLSDIDESMRQILIDEYDENTRLEKRHLERERYREKNNLKQRYVHENETNSLTCKSPEHEIIERYEYEEIQRIYQYEFKKDLLGIINDLTPERQKLYNDFFVKKMKMKSIATQEKCSVSSISQKIKTLRKHLQRDLAQYRHLLKEK